MPALKAHTWLIGFMGSGKSSVGLLLAEKLCCRFIDTDAHISQEVHLSVEAIFHTCGESYFRELEGKLIQQICQLDPSIIATGGGMPIFHPLQGLGTIIYLQVDFEVLLERLEQDSHIRPLFKNTDQLYRLYQERCPLYRALAHHTTNANQPVKKVVQELLTLHLSY